MRRFEIGPDTNALSFAGTNASATITNNGNTCLSLGTLGGLGLPSYTTSLLPSAPATGTTCWDSTLGSVVTYDGSAYVAKAATVTAAAQTAITSLGTLTALQVDNININGNALSVAAAATEHGPGAIGTEATPTTYRYTENGVIITLFKIDLTGLDSVATGDDVIGLAAATPIAYIGRNVVATNGVIFKTEWSCLETPAGGDAEVNVVTNSSATLDVGAAGGTTYISDSGALTAGKTIQNLVPAMTTNHYYYLTGGAGDTAATYTAGMFVLTTYGHAVLA